MASEIAEPKPVKHYLDIPGWFYWYDRALFDAVLESQRSRGDLVELGAYLGRSSVILGDHIRPHERFVVVDLFGAEAGDSANKRENERSYKTLTRQQFESNYLALHDHLPEVIQGFSAEIVAHVKAGTVRFLHIDASHLYEHVAADIRNAHVLLQPDGVVVLDDFRSGHTPGVAAATWEAVVNDGLKPFAASKLKLYATWGDADFYRAVIERLVAGDDRLGRDTHEVKGHSMLQVYAVRRRTDAPPPSSAPVDNAAAVGGARNSGTTRAARSIQPKNAVPIPPATFAARAKRVIARDIAPPAFTRWVRRRKSAKR